MNLEHIFWPDDISLWEFEEIIAELINSSGWDVRLRPKQTETDWSRDVGYDIFASKKDILGELTSIIEIKKYKQTRPVGIDAVRQLYSIKKTLSVTQAILVATSHFTEEAKEFVRSRSDIN